MTVIVDGIVKARGFILKLEAYAASDANSLPSGGTLLPRSQPIYNIPIPKYPIHIL